MVTVMFYVKRHSETQTAPNLEDKPRPAEKLHQNQAETLNTSQKPGLSEAWQQRKSNGPRRCHGAPLQERKKEKPGPRENSSPANTTVIYISRISRMVFIYQGASVA